MATDLGMHCLPITPLQVSRKEWVTELSSLIKCLINEKWPHNATLTITKVAFITTYKGASRETRTPGAWLLKIFGPDCAPHQSYICGKFFRSQ